MEKDYAVGQAGAARDALHVFRQWLRCLIDENWVQKRMKAKSPRELTDFIEKISTNGLRALQ
jgi:hypothetical protein